MVMLCLHECANAALDRQVYFEWLPHAQSIGQWPCTLKGHACKDITERQEGLPNVFSNGKSIQSRYAACDVVVV